MIRFQTLSKFLAAASLSLLLVPSVFAQSANKTVNVTATLTSLCRFTTAGAGAATLTANYTAFTATAVAPSTTAAVECTRGTVTAPTFTWTGGTIGVVGGLVFQLSTVYTAGTAGTAPGGTLITDVGTPRTGSVAITATFPAGQAGTSGAVTPVAKTLTVTF